MNEELLLTLPLTKWLNGFLKDKDNDYIEDLDVAKIIGIVDKQELVSHIEWYSKDKLYFDIPFEYNPTPKKPAVLWRIHAWRISCNLYVTRKEKAEQTLKEDLARRDSIVLLTAAIMERTALPAELAEHLAVKIVMQKNTTAANNYGIKLII